MLFLRSAPFGVLSVNTTSANADLRPRLLAGLSPVSFSSFPFLREGMNLLCSRQDGAAGTVTVFLCPFSLQTYFYSSDTPACRCYNYGYN